MSLKDAVTKTAWSWESSWEALENVFLWISGPKKKHCKGVNSVTCVGGGWGWLTSLFAAIPAIRSKMIFHIF